MAKLTIEIDLDKVTPLKEPTHSQELNSVIRIVADDIYAHYALGVVVNTDIYDRNKRPVGTIVIR